MQFKTIVRSEHLNHNGCLFGGYMLLWVDEYAYIAALEEYPTVRFVTRAMEAASFSQSVHNGAILTFNVTRQKIGRTSVTYLVEVTARDVSSENSYSVFSTHVTMCSIGASGEKKPLPEK